MKDRQDLSNSLEGTPDTFMNNMEQEWDKSENTHERLSDDLNEGDPSVNHPGTGVSYTYAPYFMLDYLTLRNS